MKVEKIDDLHYANLNCRVEKAQEFSKDGKQIFKFIASTPEEDHDGDIIELDGWDTTDWEKNPTILWGHDRKGLPIGRGISVAKDLEKKALVIGVEMIPKETYPFAGLVTDMLNQGYLKGVSVGFKPVSYEERTDVETDSWFPPLHFTKQKLLELSVVNVPANPSALLVTNSIQRELLYSKGIFPGRVQKLIFDETDISKCTEWAKSHDFSYGKPSMDKGAHVFEQASEDSFDNLRTVLLEKGIKAVIGRPKQGKTIATAENSDVLVGKTEIVFSEKLESRFSDLSKSINDQNKIFIDLKDSIKGLASLAEALSEKDTGAPGVKPDGLSEQYLKGLNAKALELASLVKVK